LGGDEVVIFLIVIVWSLSFLCILTLDLSVIARFFGDFIGFISFLGSLYDISRFFYWLLSFLYYFGSILFHILHSANYTSRCKSG